MPWACCSAGGRELALTAASSEEMSSLELFEAQRETGPCYDGPSMDFVAAHL